MMDVSASDQTPTVQRSSPVSANNEIDSFLKSRAMLTLGGSPVGVHYMVGYVPHLSTLNLGLAHGTTLVR